MFFYRALVLSLALHLGLIWLIRELPADKQPSQKIVEVEWLEPTATERQKQIVRQVMSPDIVKREQTDDSSSVWSEEDQRVRKQTQAAAKGLTQNRSNESKAQTQKEQQKAKEDFNPFAAAASAFRPEAIDLEKGMSTIGQTLDSNIEIGSITSLNTDRYLYYSFYSRAEVLFRSRWEPYVRRAQNILPNSIFENTANDKWTTVLEVWLKPSGEFHTHKLLKSSGIELFDKAAIQAFVEARMFPNPPRDKIEDDGFVKIKYQLTILHNPTMTARMRQ